MFLLDLAFAAELIALGFGVAMIIWASRTDGVGVAAGKFFGYVIAIAAILVTLCTLYYGTSYWLQGSFTKPMMTQQQMMQKNPMMMQRMQQMQQNKKAMPAKPHQPQGQ